MRVRIEDRVVRVESVVYRWLSRSRDPERLGERSVRHSTCGGAQRRRRREMFCRGLRVRKCARNSLARRGKKAGPIPSRYASHVDSDDAGRHASFRRRRLRLFLRRRRQVSRTRTMGGRKKERRGKGRGRLQGCFE